VDRQYQDTGYVVEGAGTLFLGEVAHEVAAVAVIFGHYIEEERFHVIVQGFGAEK
jgi:hypothetical protein